MGPGTGPEGATMMVCGKDDVDEICDEGLSMYGKTYAMQNDTPELDAHCRWRWPTEG